MLFFYREIMVLSAAHSAFHCASSLICDWWSLQLRKQQHCPELYVVLNITGETWQLVLDLALSSITCIVENAYWLLVHTQCPCTVYICCNTSDSPQSLQTLQNVQKGPLLFCHVLPALPQLLLLSIAEQLITQRLDLLTYSLKNNSLSGFSLT